MAQPRPNSSVGSAFETCLEQSSSQLLQLNFIVNFGPVKKSKDSGSHRVCSIFSVPKDDRTGIMYLQLEITTHQMGVRRSPHMTLHSCKTKDFLTMVSPLIPNSSLPQCLIGNPQISRIPNQRAGHTRTESANHKDRSKEHHQPQ